MAIEHEREFSIEELFFSTTDAKGHIRSGNAVFARTSAYPESEMVGRAHSIVRHPDMPRSVFKLLWDHLKAGEAVAAYVKNRAKTGEPYWVMALIVPCEDGFLSVRLKPSSPMFQSARAIYEEVRTLELKLGGDREQERKTATAASGKRLLELLDDAGFPSYTAFMHAALAAELASRALQVGNTTPLQTRIAGSPLTTIYHACHSITATLNALFGVSLDGYAELAQVNRELVAKSEFMLELAESLRYFSLNALLVSTGLGSDGQVLGAVADTMHEPSEAIRSQIAELSTKVESSSGMLTELGFRVSIPRLLAQMARDFAQELLDAEADPTTAADHAARRDDLPLLTGCLTDALGRLDSVMTDLNRHLTDVATMVSNVNRKLKLMQTLELNGRIEATHAADAAAVVMLFHEIREQITTARSELSEFAASADRGRATSAIRTRELVEQDLFELQVNSGRLVAAA